MISPFDYACKILKYSSKTEKEITAKLESKKYSEDIIKQTIEKLKKYNFINDQRFAADFIESKLESGYGLLFIEEKLIEKGIEKSTLKQYIKELNLTEEQEFLFAEKAFKKKLAQSKNQPKEKLYIKLGNFLESRGFPENIVEKLLKRQSVIASPSDV